MGTVHCFGREDSVPYEHVKMDVLFFFSSSGDEGSFQYYGLAQNLIGTTTPSRLTRPRSLDKQNQQANVIREHSTVGTRNLLIDKS